MRPTIKKYGVCDFLSKQNDMRMQAQWTSWMFFHGILTSHRLYHVCACIIMSHRLYHHVIMSHRLYHVCACIIMSHRLYHHIIMSHRLYHVCACIIMSHRLYHHVTSPVSCLCLYHHVASPVSCHDAFIMSHACITYRLHHVTSPVLR